MNHSHVEALVEHLFRREFARLVAGLVRHLGARHLDLAEDVVQEALLRALNSWAYHGVPKCPEAWLTRVTRNLALDRVRREALGARVEGELEFWRDREHDPDSHAAGELADDTLRLLFLCCHPALALESRVILTARQVCGLGTAEIARALLHTESAVAQRMVRAKRTVLDTNAKFELPGPSERAQRLDAVLEVLYMLFNEGHTANSGANLVRTDCTHEAVRLVELLLELPEGKDPRVFALAALFRLLGARLGSRLDSAGELLVLDEQDRTHWDQEWIQRGLQHFAAAISGNQLSRFHVEAAIALAHATATSDQTADWRTILQQYDVLMQLAPSAVVELNRAVAVARVHGAKAGLAALEALAARGELADYHLLESTRGLWLWSLERRDEALSSLRRARELAKTEPERRLLDRRIASCQAKHQAPGNWFA